MLLFWWYLLGTAFGLLVAHKQLCRADTYSKMLRNWPALGAYLFFGGIASVLIFEAVDLAGAGTVTVVQNSKALMLIVIGLLFFRETIGVRQITSVLIAVVGFVFFFWGADLSFQKGLVWAITATSCFALQNVVQRKLAGLVEYATAVMLRNLLMTIVVSVYLLISAIPLAAPGGAVEFLFIGVGSVLGGFVGKWADFKTFERIPFVTYGLFQPLKPVLAFLGSVMLLGEQITSFKLIGTALILYAGIRLVLQRIPRESNQLKFPATKPVT